MAGKRPKSYPLRGLILPVVSFLLVFFLFIYGISDLGGSSVDQQKQSLERALHRSATQCYALEGYYPPSLEYLMKNYPITYDEKLFKIDYQPVASNLMPDITVLFSD